ncbi:MAG: hypothetical protein U9O86_07325 [Campylobacterota bacterium]|nr:hypothetical protein [Campylobacterota bacterium]
MHTYQIAEPILDGYKNEKLSGERIDFLIAQANEQLEELAQNEEVYSGYLSKINPPKEIDNIVLWMLIMSNERIVDDYIYKYKKNFREIIPVSDLADLLLYAVHLKKVKKITLDGFDFFLEAQGEGIEEMDQYGFTNALLYVQKSKEVEMEF